MRASHGLPLVVSSASSHQAKILRLFVPATKHKYGIILQECLGVVHHGKFVKSDLRLERLLPKVACWAKSLPRATPYRELLRIALPSVLEMVLMSLIGSMDTIMVGTIGPSAIAAVGLVGQPRMLMLCILFAMNIGVTAVVARRKGKGGKMKPTARCATPLC